MTPTDPRESTYPLMHKWVVDGHGHSCTVCGSTVGVNPGKDSAAFPCPGPQPASAGVRKEWGR